VDSKAHKLGPAARAAPEATLGLGCYSCAFFGPCGGTFTDFDCMSGCCGRPSTCTLACPRAHGFVRVLEDCGGLSSNGNWGIQQRSPQSLPLYIPMIQHGYRRAEPLDWPIVALPTFAVTRVGATSGQIVASTDELKLRFRLGQNTRVILVSVDGDARLENFWRKRHRHRLPEALARIGIEHITGPNFSFPINVPRTDHLTNRRRMLICCEEFSRAGLSVIPHLNGINQKDWDTWRDVLRDHKDICYVCKEFQTGGSIARIGAWHIRQVLELEQRLGRALHLIAVGGARHLNLLVELSGYTIIDSVPFMKTCFRRVWSQTTADWMFMRTSPGAPLNKFLLANIGRYSELLERSRIRLQQHQLNFSPAISEAGDEAEGKCGATPGAHEDSLQLFASLTQLGGCGRL
jgi:hypothetical protein